MIRPKANVVLTAAACLLLVLAPLTMAHNTSGQERKGSAYNPGVSGRYVAPSSAGGVECLDAHNATGWAEDVDGSRPATCFSILFPATGWGAVTATSCDFEYVKGDETDEEVVENLPSGRGLVPDGTWDDGGIGGACHVSNWLCPGGSGEPGYTYIPVIHPSPDYCTGSMGTLDWYNTSPNRNGQTTRNDAPTQCTGKAFARDDAWGGDVPITVGCHYADFRSDGGRSFASCTVHALTNAHLVWGGDKVGGLMECTDVASGVGSAAYTCMGFNATTGSHVNIYSLGKGGDGVNVPDPSAFGNPCPLFNGEDRGDVFIFVTALVSANPECHTYAQESWQDPPNTAVGEEFGWFCSPRFLSLDEDGLGDTIVYLPTAGWIDHFY